MGNDVLVFAEIRDGVIKKITQEIITAAGKLTDASGGQIHVALIGNEIAPLVDKAKSFTSGKVYTVKSPHLEKYSTQGYAAAMEAIIKQADPAYVLFGATAMGKDLSSRVAAKCDAALMTDCTDVEVDNGALKVKRPVFSGKVYAEVISIPDRIKMASVRPNIYPPADASSASAEIVDVACSIDRAGIGAMVKEIVKSTGGQKDVTEAEIIVAGGRALKSAENFQILKDLADAIGGTVGASRAAVDAGYVPHSIQIGQTGKVVNPKLYIAVGVSGAIQHLVGMRTSKVIVAINKDANAPIFQKADYGIVGDLFEVVPLVTAEFKKLLASG
ncbi:MAG: electron transfer flavoprotein subunit alpha/FixB family protein [Candidatus Latescibacterota bacterium]